MSMTYSQLKRFIGKRVNIKLTNDSVIVNVKIKCFVREEKKEKIVIERNKTEEESIPLEKIKEIRVVNVIKT